MISVWSIKKMIRKNKILIIFFGLFLLTTCSTKSPMGAFRGIDIGLDPRTIGMQIDDGLMQKNLVARISLIEKKYFLDIQVEVLDGRIFLTGKVDEPEEKLKLTKMAWETKGVRTVLNAIEIRGKNEGFRQKAGDVLLTSQLRAAIIFNKSINSRNYTLETINKKIYIFGIAYSEEERAEVIKEAEEIHNVKEVIPSIYLVDDLSRNKL